MAENGYGSAENSVIVLFRSDLRLADNRALSAAAATGLPLVPAFVLDEQSPGVRPRGGARRWWLHHSLASLGNDLSALGARLVLRRGAMREAVAALVEETGASQVFWNRRHDPAEAAADAAMRSDLRARGVGAESFDGQLLHDPARVKTGSGGPYRVYTPFWRALASGGEPRDPADRSQALRPHPARIASDDLDDWRLLPQKPDWAEGLRQSWSPGEAGAQASLDRFLAGPVDGYGEGRDIPGIEGTSRLSPHLANGEITPFQILAALRRGDVRASPRDVEKFRMEIGWREFCYHVLFHNPDLRKTNFNGGFDAFPWDGDGDALSRWQSGTTGYPIVDAGMRQLWRTGWMHNRVRMIVASFLIKHLLIDWRHGEKWFWDTLVDADPASNPAGWQWVAGSGADAAPYFRIFNPVLQGQKFDSAGSYVRRWVPELSRLPDSHVHRPWEASPAMLADAGVKLGTTYPVPLIDHDRARGRALQAYQSMRGTL